jgi:putative ABC transport system ATP-binding protein
MIKEMMLETIENRRGEASDTPHCQRVPVLAATGVRKSYTSLAGRENILLDINLELHAGEVLAITAPSGAGKSSLLKILGTLDRPDAGNVLYAGVRVDFDDTSQLARLRAQQVGFVFQGFHLVPFLTAKENVILPLKLRKMHVSERQRLADTALALVGLQHRQDALPQTLSGGEQQRVAVARAIAGAPALLLCDEPTGSLNEEAGQGVFDLLQAFAEVHQRAVILVTHNEALAQQATRRLYLGNGVLRTKRGDTE